MTDRLTEDAIYETIDQRIFHAHRGRSLRTHTSAFDVIIAATHDHSYSKMDADDHEDGDTGRHADHHAHQ
jgi:hypothetical protein